MIIVFGFLEPVFISIKTYIIRQNMNKSQNKIIQDVYSTIKVSYQYECSEDGIPLKVAML